MQNTLPHTIRAFTFVIFLTASFFLTTPTHAAETEITKEEIVPCRDNNTTCWPAAFDFSPAGNIFYVERYTGQIRVYNQTKNTDKKWANLLADTTKLSTNGEQGALGIALHPEWPEKKWIYVYYTRTEPFENRVIRLRKRSDGTIERDKLISIPAGGNHNGGIIAFGADNKLYVANGETGNPALAQDLSSRAGKVLRINLNGTKPKDNPFGTYVYSYGHRNSYGFAFDPLDPTPSTVELWHTENGPDCNDELNLVESGGNYGWGSSASCPETNNSGEDAVEPLYTWDSPPSVTGAAFCNDCDLTDDVEGDLLVGEWNGGKIHHVSVNSNRTSVGEVEEFYNNGSGVLTLKAGTDKRIYFSDSSGIYRLTK